MSAIVPALTPLIALPTVRLPMSLGDHSEGLRGGVQSPFEALVNDVRVKVDARLTEVLEGKLREASSHGPDVLAMTHAVSDLTRRGGKRLRAALAMVAYVACGGSGNEAAIIDAGAALELLQSYLLIHDDWMDGDVVRRGGPSVHAMMRKHFENDAIGDSSAILAGDYACALSQEVLAGASADAKCIVRAMTFLARMQSDAIYGQQLDVAGRSEDVERMHDLKTGSYTVRGPLLMGALFTDASEEQREALTSFAGPLGIAFQLRDDLLGTFGEQSVTGKPYGNDLRAGKRTALLVEAEGRLDVPGREALAKVFGKLDATEGSVRAAAAALDGCGARDAVELRTSSLVTAALQPLQTAPLTDAGKALLAGAAHTLTERKS